MMLSKVMAVYGGNFSLDTSEKGTDVCYSLEWRLDVLGHRQGSHIFSCADKRLSGFKAVSKVFGY